MEFLPDTLSGSAQDWYVTAGETAWKQFRLWGFVRYESMFRGKNLPKEDLVTLCPPPDL